MKPLKIYIAGPYSGKSQGIINKNVRKAIDAGLIILGKGHYPFIPHLTHYVDRRAAKTGFKVEWRDYIEWDLIYLQACDALFFLGHSPGADIELKAAQKMKKIIFNDIKSIPQL